MLRQRVALWFGSSENKRLARRRAVLSRCIESLEGRRLLSAVGFGPVTSLGLANNTPNIAVGDLDGDGKAEVVQFTPGSADLTFYTNTTATGSGTPTFSNSVVTIGTGLHKVKAVFVADTNADGKNDIIIQYTNFNFAICYGTDLSTPVDVPLTFTPPQDSNVAEVLNDDGKADLLLFNKGGTSVSLVQNNTANGMTTPSFSSTPSSTLDNSSLVESTSAADLNNDGNSDVAIGYTDGNPAASLGSNFTNPPIDVGLAKIIPDLFLADFNADQKAELLGFTPGAAGLSLYTNTTVDAATTVTFDPTALAISTGTNKIQTVASGDINGDGLIDLVVGYTNGKAVVFLNDVFAAPTANSQSVSTPLNTSKGITLTGSDPNNPPQPLTYTVTQSPSHGLLSGTAPNLTYTPDAGYSGPDNFKFVVDNGQKFSSKANIDITVGAAITQISGRTLLATEGKSFTGIVADFKSSTSSNASQFTASINWSDGSTTAGTVLQDGSPGSYFVQGTHTYGTDGKKITLITVTPSSGAAAHTSGVVTVADAPLTGIARTISFSHTVTFNGVVGSFTDGNAANRNAAIYKGTVTFADGASSVASFVYNNGAARWDVIATLKRPKAGTYNLNVKVTDNGGASTTFVSKAVVS